MNRLSVAVNSDSQNGKIGADKFLNVFFLDNGERIAEVRILVEEDEFFCLIKGKEGMVKYETYKEII